MVLLNVSAPPTNLLKWLSMKVGKGVGKWGEEGKDLLAGSEELMVTNYCALGQVSWCRAESVLWD